MPLALTILIVAAAALVLADVESLPGHAAGAVSFAALVKPRCAARQCDPDAAGHVRPRAPACVSA
jgi:hypothetical protein